MSTGILTATLVVRDSLVSFNEQDCPTDNNALTVKRTTSYRLITKVKGGIYLAEGHNMMGGELCPHSWAVVDNSECEIQRDW